MPYSDFIVYVDESGDANLDKIDPNFPVFVLSFCIIPKASYTSSLIPKMSDLKFKTFGHDMVILHERELRKKEGYFQKLAKEERSAFLDELTTIIDESDLTLICVVIKKKLLQEKYVRPTEPYELAMQYGLERVYDFAKWSKQEKNIWHIVCESRGKKEDQQLRAAFKNICNHGNRNHATYPFNIIFAPKGINSNGLQLADLTARPVGQYELRPDQSNRTYPVLEKKFWKGEGQCTVIGNGFKVFPFP